MRKPSIPASVVRFVAAIDADVRRCNIRGKFDCFRDIAADVLDGWATRKELTPLIRRKWLTVIPYECDDSDKWGPDIIWHHGDPSICGTRWSVNPTERMVRILWPNRLRHSN